MLDVATGRASVKSDLSQSRISLGLFLVAAGISFAFSVTLCIWIDREIGLFVGLWVPSILSLTDLLPRLQQPNPDPIRNRANAGAQHRTP
jgi:hypothetical protein